MPIIVKLSSTNGHGHVAYLPDEAKKPDGPSPESSINSGHSHIIVVNVDGVSAMPAGDGHTHDLVDFKIHSAKPKRDSTSIGNLTQQFRDAYTGEEWSRKQATESEAFFEGDAWAKEDKDVMEDEDRPMLNLNHTAAMIDVLSGYQRQNRTDIRFFPVEDSDSNVADILNIVVKNILDQSNFHAEESAQFDDELIAGRGIIEIYPEDNPNGLDTDIKVSHDPWDSIILGPHLKPDLSDLEIMFKSVWMSEAKIRQLFPEKAKEISQTFENAEDLREYTQYASDQYAKGGSTKPSSDVVTDPDFINLARKELRVIEAIYKEYIKTYVIVDPQTAYVQAVDVLTSSERRSLESLNLEIVERNSHRMRMTAFAGTTILRDEYPEYPFNDFPISVAYAYFRRGKFWGKIQQAKDPQREINKRHSQAIDILDRCAAQGYFYDHNTFPNESAKNNFKKNSGKNGFMQEISDVTKPPVPKEGTKVPVEILQLEQLADAQFKGITNVNNELMGQKSNTISGVAILERKRQGLTGNERVFDGLAMSKKRLGRMIVAMIQQFYTPERIARIVESQARSDTNAMIGGQNVSNFSPEKIIELLKNADLTRYDVAVSESSESPTTQNANFSIMADLAGKGLPIPPIAVLTMAPIPNKAKIIQMVQEEQQRQMRIEQGKQNTEIQKSVIAANSRQQGKPVQ